MTDDTQDAQNNPKPRRHKDAMDYIQTAAAAFMIAGAVWGALGYLFDAWPVVKAATYEHDRKITDSRLSHHDQDISDLRNGVGEIQRNGQLTLQLQLRARIDALSDTLLALQKSSVAAQAIQAEIADNRQRLEEVNRALSR